MDISQEQYERLTAFFEGTLSAAEEIRFLEEVADNKALKKEFDWEMMLRLHLFKDNPVDELKNYPDFPSADEHLQQVTAAVEQESQQNLQVRPAPVFKITTAMWAAAILLLALGITVVYSLYISKRPREIAHTKPPAGNDTPAIIKNPIPTPVTDNDSLLAANSIKGKKIYQNFYRRYTATADDPIEASKFLYAYESGNYKDVIKGSTDELANKGGDQNTRLLHTYLYFYQGISYLQLKRNNDAIGKLLEARRHAAVTDNLYAAVTWYLSMAYLQSNNLTEAGILLKQLAASKNNTTYKRKASEVLKLL